MYLSYSLDRTNIMVKCALDVGDPGFDPWASLNFNLVFTCGNLILMILVFSYTHVYQ